MVYVCDVLEAVTEGIYSGKTHAEIQKDASEVGVRWFCLFESVESCYKSQRLDMASQTVRERR